ncbi:hypothetical protein [uncultured Litoreibacter sp.]|uniref:hypothetical protein n=1 Tax=uncultured Litoreibacter sp. TaxID=1392394 RepID=UPI00261FEDF4|nr:hypothetical protein [uncultured Litoreibacter sp.]
MTENACKMEIELLEKRQSGQFDVEIIGSPVLCLEAIGDANLAPFTATARITNRGAEKVTVHYRRGVSSAFQSVSYWPSDRPDKAIAFNECCGDTQSGSNEQKSLAQGEALLISSWTRHHNGIWSQMLPALNAQPLGLPRDYIVRFSLSITYDAKPKPVTLVEDFEVMFRAVPN